MKNALLILSCALWLVSPLSVDAGSDSPLASDQNHLQPALARVETGVASYYGAKYHGRPTASGENFDMNELTAAHPTLAFGTRVKVTHLESNRSVVVRINDRGPFVKGRVIDLSQQAAAELKMIQSGLARVRIEIVE